MNERATFTAHGREHRRRLAEDRRRILPFAAKLPDRLIAHLRLLDGDYGGFPVDRCTHSLQTATRAQRDGRDEEYVVCALLHDIGDTLGTFNHPDIAAAILKPFVSEANHWMVQKHGIFQGYYFFHHLGLDRNLREQFRGHAALRAHRGVLRALRQPGLRPEGRDAAARRVRADGAPRASPSRATASTRPTRQTGAPQA